MNRAQRRSLKRAGLPGIGLLKSGFRLEGGPMDSMYVTPSAPALREGWWTTWPDSVQRKWRPGRYAKVGPDKAVWRTQEVL